MLAAILVATSLVVAEGYKPPVIHDDLMNDVKWSTAHDYEVHDHDADQENQKDDGERYFTILEPTVAQESVQDHQVQQSAYYGNDQVSVEVNGDYGLVDHSLDRTSPVSFVNEEETLRHGDFDKIQPKPQTTQSIKSYDVNIDFRGKEEEEEEKESTLGSKDDDESETNEHEMKVQDSEIIIETDEEVSLANSEDSAIDNSDSPDSQVNTELDLTKLDNDYLSKTEFSNQEKKDEIFQIGEHNNLFIRNTTANESAQILNKPPPEKDNSILTTSQTIVLQEQDQEQQSPSPTVANTPLIKVHLLEETSDKDLNTEYKGQFLSPINSRRNEIKSLKDSPVTHISKVSSGLNPPKLVKDILPKLERRRILIEVKKKTRLITKSEDSAVSSTTDSISTADLDDQIYDEEEDDTQHSLQDQIINSDPVQPQEPARENIHLYDPPSVEDIPVDPVPPPYSEQYPTKTHQPILHHILHALLSPPSPDDEEFQEYAFLHRYSPNFVPYPAYLAIPY